MINKTFHIGRLGKDPETNVLTSGQTVTNFSIAVERSFKDTQGKKGTDWIHVVAWGRLAENIAKFVRKGSLVAVVGRLQTRSFEKKDGGTAYITEVVAEEVQFLDTKKPEIKEDYTQYGFEEVTDDWKAPF